MRPASNKKNSGWVLLAWGLNGFGILALLVILIFYLSNNSAHAAVGTPATSPAARPTRTPVPTSFYLPTITPNPRATEIEDYSTPTPFVFTSPSGSAPILIGYSVKNRPIEAYSFGQGESQYLIVAGIHGGYEGNTVDLANELIVYISQHPEAVSSGSTLYIIPDMNPDAVARGRNADARVNANGVDLNRNFPTPNWTANWDHSNCWNDRPTTGGAYGGSEPETKAVMNFIFSHHFQAMISYHSAALGVFPGGVPWEPASEALARSLSRVTGYPYPPIDIGCVYTGTLADWAVENGVGAAVDMELANHRDSDFTHNLQAMKVLVNFQP
jgi:murein peptide amidase A